MRSSLTTLLLTATCLRVFCQAATTEEVGQFMLSEDIGLAMNRSQVMAAAEEAWRYSFGQEPGGKLTRIDPENGLIEGTARMNYRSSLLTAREETMGTVSYQVTIQASNGKCHVRVHNLVHAGNRSAAGGGIHMGIIQAGTAPAKHYPRVGLSLSRRMHADVRAAASSRIQEALRLFTARSRLLGEK